MYRTLLPVPAWLEYYGKDGDNFAAGYLVLKVMHGMVFFSDDDRVDTGFRERAGFSV